MADEPIHKSTAGELGMQALKELYHAIGNHLGIGQAKDVVNPTTGETSAQSADRMSGGAVKALSDASSSAPSNPEE